VSPRPAALPWDDAVAALADLPAWSLVDGRLVRRWIGASWADALAAAGRIGEVAERLDHHPDWAQSGATLRIAVTTHSAGGVTALDVELARAIDDALGEAP
jgi:4a-hydroxytetrahydrobiopterin dehydratase